ncbi:stage VI sporulation protein D [Virgibacillus kimchii]
MSQGNQTFRFELNESIYFEKGQEVDEMKGISLDPDITIEPYKDYISIRGVIELKGEYQKKTYETEQEEEVINPDQFESKHYVERVVDSDDGDTTFIHRFPVEISVPTYRITDLNDVTVYIESFDYELPKEDLLRLYSTIEIHGIHETMKDQENESMEGSRKEEETEDIRENESFQFEVKDQAETSSESFESLHTDHLPVLEEQKEIPEEENAKEESGEKDRWKYKETKTLKEFFAQMPSSESESSSASSSESDISSEGWLETSENESSSMTYEISSDDREEKLEEDVDYLSAMFRAEEEEEFAKVRLCIVQEKDTIETIAERYQVTALQLIKQNGLDNDFEIRTGQLLYIPY